MTSTDYAFKGCLPRENTLLRYVGGGAYTRDPSVSNFDILTIKCLIKPTTIVKLDPYIIRT